ncbi:hypothetical protein CRUP_005096 [Coryphaenoides rupestris]|nr:hypothetical protein CRUP_005096 [Coryphaenoides rupestris]
MDPLKAQQLAAELEVEMMADMYNRMTNACHRKCVPPHYKEAELTKGESVCLDRCVAKYLDLHEKLGRKLTELSVQDEEMEASDTEHLLQEEDHPAAPPDGELQNVANECNINGQMEEFLGPQAEYDEEEEERKYYRRKRLGVIKNVVAASLGGMIVYSIYMGLLQMQLVLHNDITYRDVKYSTLGLQNIDHKMLMGINVTPIIGLLYTPILIRFLGTKWMMFLASGIYALFVSTNYWERYYTLEQKRPPKGACHTYVIVFQSVFYMFFHLSLVFAEFPMRLFLHSSLQDYNHTLYNVQKCGAEVSGFIPNINTTLLTRLPRSLALIWVESVLMGFAFLSMIIFLVLCGPAYRPTEEIDLRSIGWGNIFQLPFKHLRDYRLRLLCPFFIYSGFEILFAISGFSMSYGVCVLGLEQLWLLVVCYGLSCSLFSILSLSLLRFPRWVTLIGGAVVHFVLIIVLLCWSPKPKQPQYLVPMLIIAVLWGIGTALNKTSLSIILGMLYEDKERLDFVFTIYHWWQAVAIFIVYLWTAMPMRAKLSILLAALLVSCYCYGVKGYRYLEEDNSDESGLDDSEEEGNEEGREHLVEEEEEEEEEEGRGGGGGAEGWDRMDGRPRRRDAQGVRAERQEYDEA